MRELFLNVILLALCTAAVADDESSRGRRLLEQNCSHCHAIGAAGKSPREGAPPFRNLSRSFNMDTFDQQLRKGILSIHPAMPNFRFTRKDAQAIRSYLRTIQE